MPCLSASLPAAGRTRTRPREAASSSGKHGPVVPQADGQATTSCSEGRGVRDDDLDLALGGRAGGRRRRVAAAGGGRRPDQRDKLRLLFLLASSMSCLRNCDELNRAMWLSSVQREGMEKKRSMLVFLHFSSGMASIGRFPPFLLRPFPAIQRGEQCPNPLDLESYVFPTFHLQCKGALNMAMVKLGG